MFQISRLTIHPDRWGKYSSVRISEGANTGENIFWRIVRGIFYPGLKKLNLRAGIWHSLLTILIIIVWTVKTPPFKLLFKGAWSRQTQFPPALYSTVCNGTEYKDDSVWNWFDCIRGNVTEWRDKRVEDVQIYQPVLVDNGIEPPVALLLLVFEFLTACAHFWLYYSNELYKKRLKECFQPWRWIEYSASMNGFFNSFVNSSDNCFVFLQVTASLMAIAALSLSRVQHDFLLASIFLCQVALNIIGGLGFEAFYMLERKTKDDPDFKIIFGRLKWTCFVLSWFFYLIFQWTVYSALDANIQPLLALPTAVFWKELFQFVIWINVAISISFSAFPIIHLVQFLPTLWDGRTWEEQQIAYKRGEVAFIWASFVSKSTMVGIISFAAFNRDD
jgi:hypothetical protein